jgi:UPF0755 protein
MTINTNSVLRIITWIEWIILLLIIALLFYISLPVKTQKVITIPKGSTSESIISQLSLEGYDVGAIDRLILSKLGAIKSGEVRFGRTQSMERIDFLHRLTQAKIPLLKITLIPGETTEIFLSQVAKKLDINQTKLKQAYQRYAPYPEAAIAANTYLVPKKINEAKLIRFLLKNSQQQYRKLAKKYGADTNRTSWQRILTIASIIQKEAAGKEEMPLISSVIYNRLNKKMRLQMDGTLNYGKYSHIKVTPQRIREDNSTFNTYKHHGLPKSPIGAVSPAAIDAALHPVKSDYLYFMRNKRTGRHDFSKTFTTHRRNITKAKHQHKCGTKK